MKNTKALASIAVSLLLASSVSNAGEHVIAQKDKAFSVTELVIKAGDVVSFLNSDPFFHNIFSLSDAATFDLGSYPEGESRDQEFATPGIVEIECAIHPRMKLRITVEE